ncbi:MAG: hypothetical protein U0X39_06070 [Bacteroidales bacterium]
MNTEASYVMINEATWGGGINLDINPYSKAYFGFTTIHGRQKNQHFVSGLGTGASFYKEGVLVPLFLDLRYWFNLCTTTPYLYGDGGLLMSFKNFSSDTRYFINPGIGFRRLISNTTGINFSTGFMIQMGSGISWDSFVNLKLGLTYIPGGKSGRHTTRRSGAF